MHYMLRMHALTNTDHINCVVVDDTTSTTNNTQSCYDNFQAIKLDSFHISDRGNYLQIYQQYQQSNMKQSSKVVTQQPSPEMIVSLGGLDVKESDIDVNEIDPIEAYYQDNAFLCLSKRSPIRRLAIKLTLWPYLFIILVSVFFFFNCLNLKNV